MSVKCGRCRGYHPSVADVRTCYNGGDAVTQKSTVSAKDRLSEPQVGMVNKLMRKLSLVWAGETPVEELARWGTGRVLIDQLKAAEEAKAHGQAWDLPTGTKVNPHPPADSGERYSRTPMPEVPEGLYATPSLTGNNDLDFWRVKPGRNPGIVFVNRVIGGHQDTEIPYDSKAKIKTERVAKATQRTALEAIVKFGIEKSNELAGMELKFCRRCGIHLTDEVSRALGIGPVCGDR